MSRKAKKSKKTKNIDYTPYIDKYSVAAKAWEKIEKEGNAITVYQALSELSDPTVLDLIEWLVVQRVMKKNEPVPAFPERTDDLKRAVSDRLKMVRETIPDEDQFMLLIYTVLSKDFLRRAGVKPVLTISGERAEESPIKRMGLSSY